MSFPHCYRGEVISEGQIGKCKIFIPVVYPDSYYDKPESLPWAEPAMPLFGGNDNGNGYTGWARVGAIVWVFFEQGDHNYPVYFAACQGGSNWSAVDKDTFMYKTTKYEKIISDSAAEVKKETITGNVKQDITGNVKQDITGNNEQIVDGENTIDVTGSSTETVGQSKTIEATQISLDGDTTVEPAATGSFTSLDGRVVVVKKGIIISIT